MRGHEVGGLPWWFSSKGFTCQCRRFRFNRWVGKISWRRKWQPTPVFFSGKSHVQRSLAGYSPCGCKRVKHDWATFTLVVAVQLLSSVSLRSMECSPPPGSSLLGISHARVLEWVAISFSRRFSWPRGQTCVSRTGRRILLSHQGGSLQRYEAIHRMEYKAEQSSTG